MKPEEKKIHILESIYLA